jgi:hypothetical protein
LNELVKVTKDHNDLDRDEVNIISGVLEMRKKAVGDIMTPIEDAYMLSLDSILDFETVSKIMNSGELKAISLLTFTYYVILLRIFSHSRLRGRPNKHLVAALHQRLGICGHRRQHTPANAL